MALEEFRSVALGTRPDLKAAMETIDKAETDHKLAVSNGSTDPTFGVDFGHNPPIAVYMGVSVNIPLRIFDRNQGEKERTQIDIAHAERTEGRRGGAGIQRCRFGLLHADELGESIAAVSERGRLSGDSLANPRHHVVCLPAGPGGVVGLSGRSKRLSPNRSGLHQPGGIIPDRRQPVKHAVGREVIQ